MRSERPSSSRYVYPLLALLPLLAVATPPLQPAVALDLRQVANPAAAKPPVVNTPTPAVPKPVVATPAVVPTATPVVATPPAKGEATPKTTPTPAAVPGKPAAPVAPAAGAAVPPAVADPNGAASVLTQVSPVTTMMQEQIGKDGATKQVQVVYTQLFDSTPDQWPEPNKGQIGLGKIQGKVGVVKEDGKKKRDADANPEPYPDHAAKRHSQLEERKVGKGSSGSGGGDEDAAGRTAGPITSSVVLLVGLVAVVVAALV